MQHEHSAGIRQDHHTFIQNNHQDHDRNIFMRIEHPKRSMNPVMHNQNNIRDDKGQEPCKTKITQVNNETNREINNHHGHPRNNSNNISQKSY